MLLHNSRKGKSKVREMKQLVFYGLLVRDCFLRQKITIFDFSVSQNFETISRDLGSIKHMLLPRFQDWTHDSLKRYDAFCNYCAVSCVLAVCWVRCAVNTQSITRLCWLLAAGCWEIQHSKAAEQSSTKRRTTNGRPNSYT